MPAFSTSSMAFAASSLATSSSASACSFIFVSLASSSCIEASASFVLAPSPCGDCRSFGGESMSNWMTVLWFAVRADAGSAERGGPGELRAARAAAVFLLPMARISSLASCNCFANDWQCADARCAACTPASQDCACRRGTGACQVQHGGGWQGLQECAQHTLSLRDACAMLGVKGSVRGYHAQVVALSGNVLELPLISGAAGNPSERCATEGPRAGRETQSSHPAASACTHDCAVAVTQADLQGLDSLGFRHIQEGGVPDAGRGRKKKE